ncbi:putative dihydroxy-acid dehydratase [Helianthus anomalus]
MEDVHKIGGTPAVLRYLLELGYLDGDCITVTGKTLAENAKLFPSLSEGQQIIRPPTNPIKETGHIQILYGNLAPNGSVAKITGKEGLYFSGPALVFEGEESMIAAISEDPSSFKGKVVVIRGEGPKGGPGMPEMLTPTSAIMGAGLGKVHILFLTSGLPPSLCRVRNIDKK